MEISLKTALEKSFKLEEALLKEFSCLKTKDLENFESIQNEKVNLLNDLSQITNQNKQIENNLAHHDNPMWNKFLDKMEECKNLHKRNQILVNRKLDAIKGALQTLGGVGNNSVEIYDRLGRISRKNANKKGFDEA